MKRFILPTLLVAVLAACSSTPTTESNSAAPISDGSGGKVTTVDTGGVTRGNLPPELTDPKNILSKRSVYFDYDSFVIRSEAQPLVQAHARFLQSHPDLGILIQGNTDERGSSEYNLALGQKRAEAVKKALLLLGAKETQLEAVSLGKEKPRCMDASETCYAENRRADIVYKGE